MKLVYKLGILILICIIILLYFRHGQIYENLETHTWDRNSELLIVSSHWNEDLEWLKHLNHPVIVCGKEGEETPAIPATDKCKTPNIGFETSSYLKFIIEYYDNLPKNIAFIHGHEKAYHQHKDLKEIFNSDIWKQNCYYSLNFSFSQRCKNSEEPAYRLFFSNILKVWDTYFEPVVKKPLPNCIILDIAAQFIVPRDVILRYSKETYEKWYNLIIRDYEKYDMTSKDMAIVFEHVWQLIFS